ncbi:MAG: hypothetical protein WDZ35_10000 [Crocinitomicaceae bacterium]
MRFLILILLLLPTLLSANPVRHIDIARHPSKNILSIDVENATAVTVNVFADELMVWSENKTDDSFLLDFTYYPAGLYKIQITANGSIEEYNFQKD